MSILEHILAEKAAEVAERRRARPVTALRESPLYERPTRSLMSALARTSMGVIAEVKKASPSKGVLREDFDPVAIATSYRDAGAAAISVLTDEKFFQGSLEFLTAIRAAVTLPLLRKDFIVDPYQIHEAKAAGADAILLIVAALRPEQLRSLLAEAHGIGLDALVEVHTAAELGVALEAGAGLIGINNRNLDTFETTIATSLALSAMLPRDVVGVSESGISTGTDLKILQAYGLRAVLVGEAFMRASDPGVALRQLIEEGRA
jgi:indole-3-glycerol phosphate synthase